MCLLIFPVQKRWNPSTFSPDRTMYQLEKLILFQMPVEDGFDDRRQGTSLQLGYFCQGSLHLLICPESDGDFFLHMTHSFYLPQYSASFEADIFIYVKIGIGSVLVNVQHKKTESVIYFI